jgi:hypothetical protein
MLQQFSSHAKRFAGLTFCHKPNHLYQMPCTCSYGFTQHARNKVLFLSWHKMSDWF